MKVLFIERKNADTPSIETVFRRLAEGIKDLGLIPEFEKLPFGNGARGILQNLSRYRPRPADVYHITGHVQYIALVLPRDKTILTVHDLRILEIRKGLRRAFLKKLLFDWPVRRLNWVTTISEKTRSDLVRMTGVDPDKIVVIGNPLPNEYKFDRRPFNEALPVFLHIGTGPHKNLERVIQAVDGLAVHLRVIGELSPEQSRMLDAADLEFSNVRSLPAEQMLQEYRKADAVVFCSLFEGFGLPIIEAQAIGRPVITSSISPMAEVAGDGAVLVDPSSVVEIRSAIQRVMADAALRAEMVEKGQKNVERFRLNKIAEQYADLYRKVGGS